MHRTTCNAEPALRHGHRSHRAGTRAYGPIVSFLPIPPPCPLRPSSPCNFSLLPSPCRRPTRGGTPCPCPLTPSPRPPRSQWRIPGVGKWAWRGLVTPGDQASVTAWRPSNWPGRPPSRGGSRRLVRPGRYLTPPRAATTPRLCDCQGNLQPVAFRPCCRGWAIRGDGPGGRGRFVPGEAGAGCGWGLAARPPGDKCPRGCRAQGISPPCSAKPRPATTAAPDWGRVEQAGVERGGVADYTP